MNYNMLLLDTAAGTTGATAQSGPSMWIFIIEIVVLVALFYFLFIRPQKKKQKKEEKMRNSVQVGDEILTIGGIYGKVVSIKEDSYVIESPVDHSKIKIAKWAMQTNNTVHDDVK